MTKLLLEDLITATENHLKEKGYSNGSMKRLRCIWNHFARYSSDEYFSMKQGIAFLKSAYGIEWSEFPPPMVRHKRRSMSALRFLRDFEQTGSIAIHRKMKPEYVVPNQFAEAYDGLINEMDAQGYSGDYIRGVKRNIYSFLIFLDECGIGAYDKITANHIMQHIDKNYASVSVGTLRTVVGRIRSFMNYIYIHEYTGVNISKLLPPVRNFRLSKIPTVWDAEAIQKTLSAIDRETATGKRDFTILLIAVSLGLRISDILNLQFDSMNWEQSQINIAQVKTGELLTLSMPQELSWAIIDYLKNGRPNAENQYIFIRHCAPYQRFCINTNFHYQIRKYAQLANVELPSVKFYGMHSLRSTFASNLLKAKTPLHLISELLGHKGCSATSVYLKIDDEQLKLCALDPEMEVTHSEC